MTQQRQPTYQEMIAQARREREQQQRLNYDREAREYHAEAVQRRDAAAASGDWNEFHEADSEAEQIEREYREYFPQTPQQQRQALWATFTPREQEHVKRRWNWQPGMGWDQKMAYFGRAAQHALQLGAARDTPEYYELIDRSMETYLKELDPKLAFDRENNDTLTATEAARISGISPNSYNANVKAMAATGRIGAAYWKNQK